MKEDNSALATIARAKELVVETADAGENQHKLLTLALILLTREKVQKHASMLNQSGVFGSELGGRVQKHLDNPDAELLAELTDSARAAVLADVEAACTVLKIYDLYKSGGGEL